MRRLVLACLVVVGVLVPGAAPAQAVPEVGSVTLVGGIHRWPNPSTLTFLTSQCLHAWAPPSPTPEVGSFCHSTFKLQGPYVAWNPARFAETVRFSGSWWADGRTYTAAFDIPYAIVATYNTTPGTATGTVSVNARTGPATFTWVTEYNAATGNPTFQGVIDYTLT